MPKPTDQHAYSYATREVRCPPRTEGLTLSGEGSASHTRTKILTRADKCAPRSMTTTRDEEFALRAMTTMRAMRAVITELDDRDPASKDVERATAQTWNVVELSMLHKVLLSYGVHLREVNASHSTFSREVSSRGPHPTRVIT
ncbi:hypothetical protein ACLB2K_073154 [Fragaria x ananassa]